MGYRPLPSRAYPDGFAANAAMPAGEHNFKVHAITTWEAGNFELEKYKLLQIHVHDMFSHQFYLDIAFSLEIMKSVVVVTLAYLDVILS